MILTEWKRLPGKRKQRKVYDGSIQRVLAIPEGYAWQTAFPNGYKLSGSVATEEQAEQAANLAWDAFSETSQAGMPVPGARAPKVSPQVNGEQPPVAPVINLELVIPPEAIKIQIAP